MEQNGVKKEGLAETLNMILAESQLRNPVHNRRIQFLQSKRGGMSHSDFWALLEERITLIEFEILTAEGLATHLFLQKGDQTMTRLAAEILFNTDGKEDARRLRNEIKAIEASQWYEYRNVAKKVGGGAGGGGGRWCDKCQSPSHNTDKCWGVCKFCGKMDTFQPSVGKIQPTREQQRLLRFLHNRACHRGRGKFSFS